MRPIMVTSLDKMRPVLVLTREEVRAVRTDIVAPVRKEYCCTECRHTQQ